MKKSMLGRGIVYIIASTLCVTSFTGCGKAGNAISEAAKYAEIDKEQTYELEKLDGIISEGEIIKTMDYINGKVRALSVIDGKKEDVYPLIPMGRMFSLLISTVIKNSDRKTRFLMMKAIYILKHTNFHIQKVKRTVKTLLQKEKFIL